VIPELADPTNRDLFLTLAALLSPQQKPRDNWNNAIYAMQGYVKTGKIALRKPSGKMFGVLSHTTGLQLMQHLIDTKGIEGALRFVTEPQTGKAMAEFRRDSGIFASTVTKKLKDGTKVKVERPLGGYTPSEVNLNDTLPGIYAMGPKVGDFMQNSVGLNPDAVTVDLWAARTYNRLIGRLMDVSAKEQEKGGIASELRGRAERDIIKSLIRDAAKEAGIPASSMQAALWYFEQRLYRNHGIKSDSQNFSGAARSALKQRNVAVPVSSADGGSLAALADAGAGAFQQGARGAFSPADTLSDQDGNPVNLIQIFEKADVSTFLHESGHFWLEQLKADALRFKGEMAGDWQTVVSWWVSRSDEIRAEALARARKAGDTNAVVEIAALSDQQVKNLIAAGELRGQDAMRFISVAMHEQWARGTESYFRSGTAPSIGLADMFVKFAAWLKSVYRALVRATGRDGLDVQFSPEVKAVMDRMLATDNEIDIAASQYRLSSLFETAQQAGMSEEEFATHQTRIGAARDAAKARHLAKHVRQIERERTEWWKAEREGMRADVEAEIARQPEYRLLHGLTTGQLADGTPVEQAEALLRLDKAGLEAAVGKGSLKELPRVSGKAIYAPTSRNSDLTPPAVAAAIFGYPSPQAMVDALKGLRPFAEVVEQTLDTRMAEKHGTLDDGRSDVAAASIHETDAVAKVMSAELAALRTTEPAFEPKFIRAYARQKVGNLKAKDLKPEQLYAAERRAARKAGAALAKGDRTEAYRQQFQRLVSHEMARAAVTALEQIQKQTDYLDQFKSAKRKWKGVEADYVDKIKALVANYDFDPAVSDRRRIAAEMASWDKWIAEKQANDGAVFQLPEWLTKKDGLQRYTDLTVNELAELHDAAKLIEAQGRKAKQVRVGWDMADRATTIAQLQNVLSTMPVARATKQQDKKWLTRKLAGAAAVAAEFDAHLIKVEALLESIDGVPNGVWHKTLYQPFADAEVRKQELRSDVVRVIQKAFEKLPKEVRKGMGKTIDVGQLANGETWTRGKLLMLVLNTGNQSNTDKLIRGYQGIGWNIDENMIVQAREMLTPEEMAFVQTVWDHAEKLYPAVDEIFRSENGRSPERVDAVSFRHKGVDYRGGYFPMMYDPAYAAGKEIENLDALQQIQSTVVRATINSSFTEGRTGFAAPVLLDIKAMTRGFEKTIHFISHYDAVRNAKKILGNQQLRADMIATLGPAYANEISSWVGALAANGNDLPALDPVDRLAQRIASNVSVAFLGASYTTMVAQVFGITMTFDRLMADTSYGPVNAVVTMADIVAAMGKSMVPGHTGQIEQLSGEMKFRRNNIDRELRAGLLQLRGETGVHARAKELLMRMIAEVQYRAVDVPSWTAAYNRALRADPGDPQQAIDYADRVVRLTQSSGSLKDLSAVQRHKGMMKWATMFYSWFSVLYAVEREIVKSVTINPATVMKAAVRLGVIIVLNEIAMGFVKGELPDWEPEKEKDPGLVKHVAMKSAAAFFGSVPLVRDIAAGTASQFGYSITPVQSVGAAFVRTLSEAGKWAMEDAEERGDKFNDKAVKALAIAAGGVLGFPAVQFNRGVDAYAAMVNDDADVGFLDFLTGYDEKKAKREGR